MPTPELDAPSSGSLPAESAGDLLSRFVWKQQAAWGQDFSCKLFQKVIRSVSRHWQCPACDALPKRSCCRGFTARTLLCWRSVEVLGVV